VRNVLKEPEAPKRTADRWRCARSTKATGLPDRNLRTPANRLYTAMLYHCHFKQSIVFVPLTLLNPFWCDSE
jgi:hypothetical protein